jgi:hypothetical protein
MKCIIHIMWMMESWHNISMVKLESSLIGWILSFQWNHKTCILVCFFLSYNVIDLLFIIPHFNIHTQLMYF